MWIYTNYLSTYEHNQINTEPNSSNSNILPDTTDYLILVFLTSGFIMRKKVSFVIYFELVIN